MTLCNFWLGLDSFIILATTTTTTTTLGSRKSIFGKRRRKRRRRRSEEKSSTTKNCRIRRAVPLPGGSASKHQQRRSETFPGSD